MQSHELRHQSHRVVAKLFVSSKEFPRQGDLSRVVAQQFLRAHIFLWCRGYIRDYALVNSFLFPRAKLAKSEFINFYIDCQHAQQFVLISICTCGALRSGSLLLGHGFGNLGEERAILLRVYEFLNPR